ncbi:hypothetical protein KC333_g5341 [Hortaea werneckii]|nr:hypothetical protein KC333_g5341 [Hortaea werneckii]KAI7318429.1 hypothetical protein KC326_g3608 [Hortaea werneckii]
MTNGHMGGIKRKASAMDADEPVNLSPTPPYDPSKEGFVESVTMGRDWKEFQKGINYIHKLLSEPFEKSPHKDRFTDTLLEMIQKTLLGSNTEEVVTSLVGTMNSGGKSTSSNSLFQNGPIAREGDDGASCTLVTHLYKGLQPGQTMPFRAEVNFFSRQERRYILADLVAAYYRASHCDEDSDSVILASTQNGSEEEDLNIRTDVANAFTSLFCDHPQCKDSYAVRQFLDSATSEDDPRILNQVCDWADRAIRQVAGKTCTVVIEASTGGEMLKQLEPYSIYVEDDDGSMAQSLWPLVSIITVHFDDPITRLGIVFMDVPGSTDTSRTRRMSAAKHKQLRTHVLIVTDAARAKDDPTVAKEVKSMRNRGSGRVVVISPRSDVIGDSTMPPGSLRDKDIAEQLKKKMSHLEKEVNALDIKICNADEDEELRLLKEKRELDVRLKLAQNREKAHRIRMRSDSNRQALQQKLGDILKSEVQVPVFSISNLEYARHLKGFHAKNAPVLSVEETMIPTLRRTVFAFPNEARLNEAKFVQHLAIPRLLERLNLYTSRTALDRKTDMESYVKAPLDRYAAIVDSVFASLSQKVQQCVLTPLVYAEQQWTQVAIQLCNRWEIENDTNKFMALMKRDGKRQKSSKNPGVNLNAELSQIKAEFINANFFMLQHYQKQMSSDLHEEMTRLCETIMSDMSDDKNAPFVALAAFFDFLKGEMKALAGAVSQGDDRLADGLILLASKLTSDGDEGYIAETMMPIYAQCRAMKPSKGVAKPNGGWPSYRKQSFKREVCKLGGVWHLVTKQAESDMNQLITTEREKLKTSLKAVFEDLVFNYNMLCEAKESNDPKEKELREQLAVNIERASLYRKGPMQEALDRMLSDFRS